MRIGSASGIAGHGDFSLILPVPDGETLPIRNFKLLSCFRDCTSRIVLDLVGKPEDRFSSKTDDSYCMHEPRRGKTGLRGFRPGLTQTDMCVQEAA